MEAYPRPTYLWLASRRPSGFTAYEPARWAPRLTSIRLAVMRSDYRFSTRDAGYDKLKLSELMPAVGAIGTSYSHIGLSAADHILQNQQRSRPVLMQQRGVINRVGPRASPIPRSLIEAQMATKNRTSNIVTHILFAELYCRLLRKRNVCKPKVRRIAKPKQHTRSTVWTPQIFDARRIT